MLLPISGTHPKMKDPTMKEICNKARFSFRKSVVPFADPRRKTEVSIICVEHSLVSTDSISRCENGGIAAGVAVQFYGFD